MCWDWNQPGTTSRDPRLGEGAKGQPAKGVSSQPSRADPVRLICWASVANAPAPIGEYETVVE